MAARDFAPRGYARQALKDLDMVKELARGLKSPTPMTGQTAELFRILVAKGHGETDGTAILKLFDASERL
jgi:3-hydroxyisobutyrate dehydrogenase-like beta-hydroxyacid dehydrogenase